MTEEHVEALLENVHGLVAMLHEVYEVAVNCDSPHSTEAHQVLRRAEAVLTEHGVEV